MREGFSIQGSNRGGDLGTQGAVNGAPPEPGRRGEDRIGTPANIVTMVRILCVPIFVVSMLCPWPEWLGGGEGLVFAKPFVAALIFVILSATDTLDGYLARSRGEVTTFGKFLDPLADKILVICAMLCLIEMGSMPSWIAMVVVVREFLISGVRMIAASRSVVIAASWFGKWKTALTMVAVVLFIVKDSDLVLGAGSAFASAFEVFSWVVMLAAVVMTIVSLVDYLVKSAFLFTGKGRDGK